MHATPRLAVFCGPSLPVEDRYPAEGVTYLPPAARGDVERAANDFDAVLLIDGVFHHDLAPSPKECYAATRVAQMFGAASMGALRAAECWPYGFTPLGAIARWYICGVIDGDDEVAVLTHPQTHAALTVPVVNARYVAWIARRRGILTQAESADYLRRVRSVFFMERAWSDLVDASPERARNAVEGIVRGEADLKRIDARFSLRSTLRALRTGHRVPSRSTVATRDRVWGAGYDTAPAVLPKALPKAPGTYDRAVPFERTLELVPLLRERYGITRVGDTTWLDRTGIPTFCAIVPDSPDLLGVYNGKGLTPGAARASAVMEAVERQIGADVRLRTFMETVANVGKRLDLETCGLRDDARALTVDCVLGTELLSGEMLPLPLALVQCPWYGPKLFDSTTSNGLASGNNLTEAIYHGLCELIERHAWSMTHVRCALLPRLFGGLDAPETCLVPEIELPTGDAGVDRLLERMAASNLNVRALLLAEGTLPYTVLATVTEHGVEPPMAHMGLGCALSPAHALTRALTEAVQSRVVDIQAAREDIRRPGDPGGPIRSHTRRTNALPSGRWYFDVPGPSIALADIDDRSNDDLAQDLARTLSALKNDGFASVCVADLSPESREISVVRVVVPGLEHYVFSNYLGPRARAVLDPFSIAGL